jgi:hypothetical protein
VDLINTHFRIPRARGACRWLSLFVGKIVNRLQRPESAWDLETASEGLEDIAERLGSSLRPFQLYVYLRLLTTATNSCLFMLACCYG